MRSLREIDRRRAALLRASRGRTTDAGWAAVALHRLIDARGIQPAIVDAIDRSLRHAVDPELRAALLLARASASFEAGDLRAAERWAQEAIRFAQATELPRAAIAARWAASRLALARGDRSRAEAWLREGEARTAELAGRTSDDAHASALRAEAAYARAMLEATSTRARNALEGALAIARRLDWPVERAVLTGILGNFSHDLGDLPSAAAWFSEAERVGARIGARSVVAIFRGYGAWVAHERGQLARAARGYDRAIRLSSEARLPRFVAHFRALRALLRPPRRAAIELAAALDALDSCGDEERRAGLGVLRAVVHARAARALPDGPGRVAELAAGAIAVMSASPSSDDGRIATRLARSALVEAMPSRREAEIIESRARSASVRARGGSSRTQPAGASAPTLITISADGAELTARGRTVSLAKHLAGRRIVLELALAWGESRAASDRQLIAAAWPDERLSARSADHRLRVAISRLRRDGLGALLARSGDGYRLDAARVALTGWP